MGTTTMRNRNMTVSEAWEVMYGFLRDMKVNDCCKVLGLNYGQVYSVRYGDIFKKQMKNRTNFSKFFMKNK